MDTNEKLKLARKAREFDSSITKTSHTLNGLRTLKIQYFS